MQKIKEYVEELVDLMVDKGTPPFVLANNISRDDYLAVNLTKIEEKIVVVTKFLKEDQVVTFKYYYTENEVLYKKEVTEKSSTYVYWDRKEEMKKLVKKIAQLSGYKDFLNTNNNDIEKIAKRLISKVS
ncbi:hypothetical protein [Natronospora cellulosivora (SeqCode)]